MKERERERKNESNISSRKFKICFFGYQGNKLQIIYYLCFVVSLCYEYLFILTQIS